MSVLEARELSLEAGRGPEVRPVLRRVSLAVEPGTVVAVVGESGAGKTMLARALVGLLPSEVRPTGGSVVWGQRSFATLDPVEVEERRGPLVGFVAAEAPLDPCQRVGAALREVLTVHGWDRRAARRRALTLLRSVGISDPRARMRSYPHELSGGQRQRVAIAIALANDPKVVVADEPTSALDVTVQAQVLGVLRDRCTALGAALVLVTHDLGVVASIADRVVVLYAGRVVEDGSVAEVLGSTRHPYTLALMGAVARVDERRRVLRPIPGEPPARIDGAGCPFAPRCGFVEARCYEADPRLVDRGGGHGVACHRSEEIAALHRAADDR